MVSPAATAPVVLIIPGSGPTDRDGNNPMGVKASTYRLLAQGLAKRGVASARIDKRGMFGSAAAVPDGNAVTIEDYAADVRAWVASIRERTGSKCVWVAGHSEGGLVALAAARSVADICGLILISAPGRRMGDVMRAQLRSNPANEPVLDDALSAIGKLEAGQTVDVSTFHPALQNLFAPPVQKFLISLFSFDPADLLRRETKPVLILQGENDLQVGADDARRLAASHPAAKLILLPRVNHVLKEVPAQDRAANMAAYADPSLPLAPGVVEAIAEFVSSASKGSSPGTS
jgi:pimeloyl-ACP methyl ester carboxylesterase